MEDPAIEALRSFGKTPNPVHAEALSAIRRLNNVHLNSPIGEEGFFYVDDLNPEAPQHSPSKRARLEKIPREDGHLWEDPDAPAFGPEYRAELFQRRDLLMRNPEFAFVELVAGAAYTRVEKLFDRENLDAAFLATQKILADQRRIQAIETQRFQTVSRQAAELRLNIDEAQRTLRRVAPQTRLAGEGQSLLRALELTQEDLEQARIILNRLGTLEDLNRFFARQFAGTVAFVYAPGDYTAFYSDVPEVLQGIERQLEDMTDHNLPGAAKLLAFVQIDGLDDHETSDAFTRGLFYVVAHFMADVRTEAAKVSPDEEEDPFRRRRGPGRESPRDLDAWNVVAEDEDLATNPDLIGTLWDIAKAHEGTERTQAGLVLQTRLSDAQRQRQAATRESGNAAAAVGVFTGSKLNHPPRGDLAGAADFLRRWIEGIEPARRELQAALLDWENSLSQLDIEMARLQEIRTPELPYEHRMQWALRPENTGRIELEPIVQFGMSQAFLWVNQWLPMVANAGEAALKHSTETRTSYSILVASSMALAMNRFQVKWLPARHRTYVLRDAGQALKNLSVLRWVGRRFLRADTTINQETMTAVRGVLALS